jgi:tetratricopeptide (TPR) repeat protein
MTFHFLLRQLLFGLFLTIAFIAMLVRPGFAGLDQDKELCRSSKDYDVIISSCTSVIESNQMQRPEVTYTQRGRAFHALNQKQQAMQDFDQALNINPDHGTALLNRGSLHNGLGEYQLAIQDFDRLFQLNPDIAAVRGTIAYRMRGIAHQRLGEYEQAIQDYDKVLSINSNDFVTLNSMAWLLATAPSATVRNGPKAVSAAKKAVELNGDEIAIRDTLAAAYAENGEFSNAIAVQETAIQMLRARKAGDKVIADLKSRLDIYRQNKPYHEEPK